MNSLPIIPPWKAQLLDRKLWVLVGIILVGRLAWWSYWGTLLENDSLFYLQIGTSIYHPPLYSFFSGSIVKLTQLADAVVWAQCLIYSMCAGLMLRRMGSRGRWGMWLAFALAIEPCSGKLASTVMAETLFLSLLFLAFVAVPNLVSSSKRTWMIAAIGVGFLLGFAHLTRYVAPVFLAAVCLWLLWQRVGAKRFVLSTLLMLVAFQMVLLPIRLYNQRRSGTLQLSTFSNLSLWNSSAYLYTGSPVQQHPETAFEEFLRTFPDTTFTLKSTWYTSHMFGDYFPYQRFLQIEKANTAEAMAIANAAGNTGLKLVLNSPGRHFREFICSNVARPFHVRDHIYSEQIPRELRSRVWFQKNPEHTYSPGLWIFFFLLLGVGSIWQLFSRRKFSAMTGLVLLSCWLYLIGISIFGVIFLRFVYLLAPLIVILLGLQMQTFFKAEAD